MRIDVKYCVRFPTWAIVLFWLLNMIFCLMRLFIGGFGVKRCAEFMGFHQIYGINAFYTPRREIFLFQFHWKECFFVVFSEGKIWMKTQRKILTLCLRMWSYAKMKHNKVFVTRSYFCKLINLVTNLYDISNCCSKNQVTNFLRRQILVIPIWKSRFIVRILINLDSYIF